MEKTENKSYSVQYNISFFSHGRKDIQFKADGYPDILSAKTDTNKIRNVLVEEGVVNARFVLDAVICDSDNEYVDYDSVVVVYENGVLTFLDD